MVDASDTPTGQAPGGSPDPGTRRPHAGAYALMALSGVIGLVASLILSIDALKLAEDPLADLGCNVSDTISCAKVGLTWQASLLGFPNAFLGLIAQPVVIMLGVIGLAGVRLPRWFMLGAQAGYTMGLAFAIWLFAQSYFDIGAICPWCTVLYVSTLVAFATITRINILDGHFGPGARRALSRPLRLGVDAALVVIVLAVLAAMVLYKYV
jgi:uncharacterized membrane protein